MLHSRCQTKRGEGPPPGGGGGGGDLGVRPKFGVMMDAHDIYPHHVAFPQGNSAQRSITCCLSLQCQQGRCRRIQPVPTPGPHLLLDIITARSLVKERQSKKLHVERLPSKINLQDEQPSQNICLCNATGTQEPQHTRPFRLLEPLLTHDSDATVYRTHASDNPPHGLVNHGTRVRKGCQVLIFNACGRRSEKGVDDLATTAAAAVSFQEWRCCRTV